MNELVQDLYYLAERDAAAVDDVNTRILVQLWRIADVSRRQVEAAVDQSAHATLKQFRILEIIETSFENLCPTDLARVLACSKANVTQIVQDE